MNYSEQIFKMLGIEPEEEFKFPSLKHIYRFNKNLTVELSDNGEHWEFASLGILYDILNGDLQIIKIPSPTPQDQVVIDYARLCGCEWLAKDKDGKIFGYKYKPEREDEFCWYSADDKEDDIYVEIGYPISFLSWEDDEPYFIEE